MSSLKVGKFYIHSTKADCPGFVCAIYKTKERAAQGIKDNLVIGVSDYLRFSDTFVVLEHPSREQGGLHQLYQILVRGHLVWCVLPRRHGFVEAKHHGT